MNRMVASLFSIRKATEPELAGSMSINDALELAKILPGPEPPEIKLTFIVAEMQSPDNSILGRWHHGENGPDGGIVIDGSMERPKKFGGLLSCDGRIAGPKFTGLINNQDEE